LTLRLISTFTSMSTPPLSDFLRCVHHSLDEDELQRKIASGDRQAARSSRLAGPGRHFLNHRPGATGWVTLQERPAASGFFARAGGRACRREVVDEAKEV